MFNNADKVLDIEITMLDGTIVRGQVSLANNASVESLLSREALFLDVITEDGERIFLAKSQMVSLKPAQSFKKVTLNRAQNNGYVDAYAILGVARTASFDEVREAYHVLIKQYHPDAFAGQSLPVEMEAYVLAMFRQITTAFGQIKEQMKTAA